ncbi:MAG: hypothetical protein AB7Q17_17295 [Phycisphaerae bacterium]
MIANECSATCGDSLTGGGGGEHDRDSAAESPSEPTAADVATLLRENTAAERQAPLRAVVTTAAGSEDTATAAFWSDVFAQLIESGASALATRRQDRSTGWKPVILIAVGAAGTVATRDRRARRRKRSSVSAAAAGLYAGPSAAM